MKDFKFPLSLKIVITLFIIGVIFSVFKMTYVSFTNVYNQSIGYNLDYDQVSQDQVTSWDADYLAFVEKSTIANISKETYLQVTSIIMSARADGSNLSWKWVHENQNIPYEEFTIFYKELSAFVMLRFEANKQFERSRQQIVKSNNLMLTTFPGVLYNHLLKLPLMEYKEGFISVETRVLFNK